MRPRKERLEEIRNWLRISWSSRESENPLAEKIAEELLSEIDALEAEKIDGHLALADLHQEYRNSLDERDLLKDRIKNLREAISAPCQTQCSECYTKLRMVYISDSDAAVK